REPVHLPFVPRMTHGGQFGRRNPEIAQERVAVRRDSNDVLLPSRVENPAGKSVPFLRQADRLERRGFAAQVGYADEVLDEPRCPGDRDLVVDHAHRDAVPPEAPRDTQALVVPADDQPTQGSAIGVEMSARGGRTADGGGHPASPVVAMRDGRDVCRSCCAFFVTFSASARPAYHPPETKRMIGPKLRAAGAPRKCRPGTEDSRPRVSTG